MKKSLTVLASLLVFAASAFAQYQVGNSDFELWDDTPEPLNWSSFGTVTGSFSSYAGSSSMLTYSTEVRDGSTGEYSAKITAKKVILTIVAQGNLTTGRINAGSMTATDASGNYNYTDVDDTTYNAEFTGLPDSMSVWVKYRGANSSHPYGKISALLHAAGYYQDPWCNQNNIVDLVAYATDSLTTTLNDDGDTVWVRMSIPVVYGSSWDGSSYGGTWDGETRPAYALVTFATNTYAGGSNSTDYMYIDDMEFIYNSELASLTYDGTELYKEGETTFSVVGDYDASLLSVATNGVGATYETSFDEDAQVLTITVSGDNIGDDADNYHTYTVTFEKAITNEASAFVTVASSAAVGSTVSVTVLDGVTLYSLSVVSESGDAVTVTAGDGSYTFTMPAEAVTVTAVAVSSDVAYADYMSVGGASSEIDTVHFYTLSDGSYVLKLVDFAYGTMSLGDIELTGFTYSGSELSGSGYVTVSMSGYEMSLPYTLSGTVESSTKLYLDLAITFSGSDIAVVFGSYEITNNSSEYVTADRTAAVKGETVTVTIAEGVTLYSLSVTSESGDAVTVTENDGSYTFTMPSEDVTVAAVPAYTVTNNASDYVSVSLASTAAGETVEITANDGVTLYSLSVTSESGEAVTVTESDGSYTFTMPSEDVTVAAVAYTDSTTYSDYLLVTGGTPEASSPTLYTLSDGSYVLAISSLSISSLELSLTNIAIGGLSLESGVLSGEGSFTVNLGLDMEIAFTLSGTVSGEKLYFTLVIESYGITAYFGTYTIALSDADGLISSVSSGVSSSETTEGDVVTITPASGAEIASLFVETESGEVTTLTAAEDGTYSFTMPGENVTIEASSTVKYAVSLSEGSSDYVSVSAHSAANDVEVAITVNDGVTLYSLSVTSESGEAVTVTEGDGSYTFTMPSEDVTVAAVAYTDSATYSDYLLVTGGSPEASSPTLYTLSDGSYVLAIKSLSITLGGTAMDIGDVDVSLSGTTSSLSGSGTVLGSFSYTLEGSVTNGKLYFTMVVMGSINVYFGTYQVAVESEASGLVSFTTRSGTDFANYTDTVYVTLSEGVEADSVTITAGDTEISLATAEDDEGNVLYYFLMPEAAVTITATETIVEEDGDSSSSDVEDSSSSDAEDSSSSEGEDSSSSDAEDSSSSDAEDSSSSDAEDSSSSEGGDSSSSEAEDSSSSSVEGSSSSGTPIVASNVAKAQNVSLYMNARTLNVTAPAGSKLYLFDITGHTVAVKTLSANTAVSLEGLPSGNLFAVVTSEQGSRLASKRISLK